MVFMSPRKRINFRSHLMQTQRCFFNRMRGNNTDGQMGKGFLFSLNLAVSMDSVSTYLNL